MIFYSSQIGGWYLSLLTAEMASGQMAKQEAFFAWASWIEQDLRGRLHRYKIEDRFLLQPMSLKIA